MAEARYSISNEGDCVIAGTRRSVTAVDGDNLMRFITRLFGMGLVCLISFTASVTADEVTLEEISAEEETPEEVTFEEISTEESTVVSSEPLFDRIAPFLNTPDDVQHAGLLGKYYFQSLAQVQDSDDPYLRSFDEQWHGYDLFVNLPLTTPQTHSHLATDFFAGYSEVNFFGYVPGYFPDYSALYYYERELNASAQAFTAGFTVYSDRGGRFRPFVQAGAMLTHSQMVSTGGETYNYWNGYYDQNTSNNVEHTYNDYEFRALFNTGFEYDINSVLAYRMTLMTETKGRFGESLLMQDLIVWPVKRFFFRVGVASGLDTKQSLLNVGGGFAF